MNMYCCCCHYIRYFLLHHSHWEKNEVLTLAPWSKTEGNSKKRSCKSNVKIRFETPVGIVCAHWLVSYQHLGNTVGHWFGQIPPGLTQTTLNIPVQRWIKVSSPQTDSEPTADSVIPWKSPFTTVLHHLKVGARWNRYCVYKSNWDIVFSFKNHGPKNYFMKNLFIGRIKIKMPASKNKFVK